MFGLQIYEKTLKYSTLIDGLTSAHIFKGILTVVLPFSQISCDVNNRGDFAFETTPCNPYSLTQPVN